MRICEKCSNFIEDLHSFVILCREGLSRTIIETPHSITSEFQTSDEEECYDYDTVSLEESTPDQQRDITPVIPEITIVHDRLRFKPAIQSDTIDPLSSLDTDSEEAGSSKNITCSVCGKVYTNRRQLQVHMNLHTNKIKYPCQYCEKVFYARKLQRDHEVCRILFSLKFSNNKIVSTQFAINNLFSLFYLEVHIIGCIPEQSWRSN